MTLHRVENALWFRMCTQVLWGLRIVLSLQSSFRVKSDNSSYWTEQVIRNCWVDAGTGHWRFRSHQHARSATKIPAGRTRLKVSTVTLSLQHSIVGYKYSIQFVRRRPNGNNGKSLVVALCFIKGKGDWRSLNDYINILRVNMKLVYLAIICLMFLKLKYRLLELLWLRYRNPALSVSRSRNFKNQQYFNGRMRTDGWPVVTNSHSW